MNSFLLGCAAAIILPQMPLSAQNQPLPSSNNPIVMWPDGAPGALGKTANDIPTLTAYFAPPDIATGAAIVICPGGGYAGLAPHEGADYARWLNEQGITGFVLKYRLGSQGYRHPRMLEDVARAVRIALISRWGLGDRSEADRHHGVFGGRTPGVHFIDTFRRGKPRCA